MCDCNHSIRLTSQGKKNEFPLATIVLPLFKALFLDYPQALHPRGALDSPALRRPSEVITRSTSTSDRAYYLVNRSSGINNLFKRIQVTFDGQIVISNIDAVPIIADHRKRVSPVYPILPGKPYVAFPRIDYANNITG